MASDDEAGPQVSDAIHSDNHEGLAPASPAELGKALYARCANQPADKTFDPEELLALGVIPDNDLALLNTCTHKLTKEGLLKVLRKGETVCWKVVKREDAAKYKNFNDEEATLFAFIESSGREGVWTRILRSKSGLPQTSLNRTLKALENRKFIKPTRNVKFPNRKCYMLAHLQPSEAATGGPFYTDGALDEAFVHETATWAERYIIGRSWSHRPRSEGPKKKTSAKLNREQAEKLRAEEIARGNVSRDRNEDMLPMPPGYTGYPTLSEITRAINASNLTDEVMKENEMQQLLDILVWDAKVEKIPNMKGYRAIRRAPATGGLDFENGLTEAPCGRCPVFDICEEGGPVNATTCEYFEDWLNMI